MKAMPKLIMVSIFSLMTLLIVVLCSAYFQQKEIIKNKERNLFILNHLEKITEKISSNKDSIIKLDKQIIVSCESDVKNISRPNGNRVTPSGFIFGKKIISVEQLLKITNDALKENIALKNDSNSKAFKLKTIREKFGISYKDTIDEIILDNNPKSILAKIRELTAQLDKISFELALDNQILGLLKDRYHFAYFVKDNEIHIPYGELDTMIEMYPLIKNKVKIKNGKIWIR